MSMRVKKFHMDWAHMLPVMALCSTTECGGMAGEIIRKSEELPNTNFLILGYMHGEGTRYFSDGKVYHGNFEYNEMHGNGLLSWPNGTKIQGDFEHNQPVSKMLVS